MKRTLALILAVLLLAGLMASCGGKTDGGKTNGSAAAAEKTLTFGCQMYSDGMICPLAADQLRLELHALRHRGIPVRV